MRQDQITRKANDFWEWVGRPEPFPRTLESSIAWALPLAVVKLPQLTLFELRGWLERRGIPSTFQSSDRALRGCLVARKGRGLVFLDGTDPSEEQRFSLAHELAHFLLDYLEPRSRATEALGEAGREVFDGQRSATLEERLTALLRDADLAPFVHLMDRSPAGEIKGVDVLEREGRCSQLALELLAPWDLALTLLAREVEDWPKESSLRQAQSLLMSTFELPRPVATRYAGVLRVCQASRQTFRQWLGDAASNFSPGTGMKE
ncbi:MAG: ImmA/IrrE family metallo-endopeptidase [Acidobacteriota bacterium]